MTREPRDGEFTRSIIGAFFDVYNQLGFGMLESGYSAALEHELRARGHLVEREFWTDVFYKGQPVARQRLDMIVDRAVVLEINPPRSVIRANPRPIREICD
jgi:GxxExxY protein